MHANTGVHLHKAQNKNLKERQQNAYHVEGHMYQGMIFFFLKVLQIFIIYESAKDRNLRAFLGEYKMHYLAIFWNK